MYYLKALCSLQLIQAEWPTKDIRSSCTPAQRRTELLAPILSTQRLAMNVSRTPYQSFNYPRWPKKEGLKRKLVSIEGQTVTKSSLTRRVTKT